MQEALSDIIGAYKHDFAKHPNLQEEKCMSEQTIQESLYSISVAILDKYACLSLGATNCFIRTVFCKRRQICY